MLFVKRLAEEALHAFIGGFAAAALMTGGELDKAAVTGAAFAGARAVLGVLVKNFGSEDRPSIG